MVSVIVFAFKIIAAVLLVIPLFLSKNAIISRDRIGIYLIMAVVSATITIISREMNSGIIAGSLFVAIGIVSLSQFQKKDNWLDALQAVAPFWLVAVIGMCVGAGMFLQAVILTAISYYIINYLPMLLGGDKRQTKSKK